MEEMFTLDKYVHMIFINSMWVLIAVYASIEYNRMSKLYYEIFECTYYINYTEERQIDNLNNFLKGGISYINWLSVIFIGLSIVMLFLNIHSFNAIDLNVVYYVISLFCIFAYLLIHMNCINGFYKLYKNVEEDIK